MTSSRNFCTLLAVASVAFVKPLAAQDHCAVICAPSINVMPSLIRSHIFSRPTVRLLPSGQVEQLPSSSNLEIIVAATAKTAIPRTSLLMSVEWLPNATTRANPFTEYTASNIGAPAIRANSPSVTMGVSFDVTPVAGPHKWGALAFNVGDIYGPAARPLDASEYTHKLDLDLVGTVTPFATLPHGNYLHAVSPFAILDYIATGLPHAGDQVPKGERVFLNDARSASLIIGISFPIAPLKRP